MTEPAQPIPGGLTPGTRTALLEVAASQLGYHEGHEDGIWNNDNAYGLWYPMNYQPWCGIFVSWCADRAGIPTTVIPKYAYTPAGFAWFKSKGATVTWNGGVQAGDVGFVYYVSLGRIAHTFIVEKVLGGGWIQTIEGNTNTSGSSQGDGVYRLKRLLNSNLFFGRPAYASEEGSEGGGHEQLPEDDMTPEEYKTLLNGAATGQQWSLGEVPAGQERVFEPPRSYDDTLKLGHGYLRVSWGDNQADDDVIAVYGKQFFGVDDSAAAGLFFDTAPSSGGSDAWRRNVPPRAGAGISVKKGCTAVLVRNEYPADGPDAARRTLHVGAELAPHYVT